jgi:NTE family protein
LVLAGGGARGAYEIGALSVLLPALEKRGDVPDIVVGTSVGAINAVYTAGNLAEDDFGMPAGRRLWEEAEWDDVLRPIHSWWQLKQVLNAGRNFFGAHSRELSLLDPERLPAFLEQRLGPALHRIPDNLKESKLAAAAVVATAASSYLSVVFHHGGGPVGYDSRRGIKYVETSLGVDHVRASAAIPAAFPSVEVEGPDGKKSWYFDGGTRLNTPIKPARDLGAKRLIVIALNAPRLSDPDAALAEEQADMFDGLSQITQAVLVDPLINDLHTIISVNQLLAESQTAHQDHELIDYILIAPRTQDRIGQIAQDVYNEHHAGKGRLTSDSVARVGKLLDAGLNVRRADLFSNLFFDGHFARALLKQGEDDATWWLDQGFGNGSHWHRGPIP